MNYKFTDGREPFPRKYIISSVLQTFAVVLTVLCTSRLCSHLQNPKWFLVELWYNGCRVLKRGPCSTIFCISNSSIYRSFWNEANPRSIWVQFRSGHHVMASLLYGWDRHHAYLKNNHARFNEIYWNK